MEKPLPVPTPQTQPFWDALAEGRVELQHCADCDRYVYYPRTHCPGCLTRDLEWRELSGNGVVHTYTVARRPTAPPWSEDVPQLIAVVELDEGPRLTTELVNVEPDAIEVGMRVQPVFQAVGEATLLLYEPA